MTKRELIETLKTLGIQPSRRLGQNFLVDPNTLDAILRTADVQPDETVLEVGPGTGVLTEALAARARHLVAVEYDSRLAEYLQHNFAARTHVQVIHADACRVDYDTLMQKAPFCFVANLPYSVSSPLIMRILEGANRPSRMCLLLQREMADRLSAQPETKAYGSLSVRFQAMYKGRIARPVSPTVFWPIPEVGSAVFLATIRDEVPQQESYTLFSGIVKAGFSQRRKKLISLLRGQAAADKLDRAFHRLELPDNVRAESLSVETFLSLARILTETE